MTFIDYDEAEPVLTEYSPDEALRILLNNHGEFDSEAVDVVVDNAQKEMMDVDNPEIVYAAYTTTVVQIRAFQSMADLSIF